MLVTFLFRLLIQQILSTKKEDLSLLRTRFFPESTQHRPSSSVLNQSPKTPSSSILLSDGLESVRMDLKSFSRLVSIVTQTSHHPQSIMINWRSSMIILVTTSLISSQWLIQETLQIWDSRTTKRFWTIAWSTSTNHHRYLPIMLSSWISATTGSIKTHGLCLMISWVKLRMFQIWTSHNWNQEISFTSKQRRSHKCTKLTPGEIAHSVVWPIVCLEFACDKLCVLAAWINVDPRCLTLKKLRNLSQMCSIQPMIKAQIRLESLNQEQLWQPSRSLQQVKAAAKRRSWTHSNQMIPTGLSVLETQPESMTFWRLSPKQEHLLYLLKTVVLPTNVLGVSLLFSWITQQCLFATWREVM